MREKKQQHIGILGEGQLARMLHQAAKPLGLNPRIFAMSADSPAGRIASDLVVGKIQESDKLRAFLADLDVVAFENEFLDTSLLKKAAQGLAVKFLPSLESLERLQDKFSQKKIFESLNFPQAAYEVVKDIQEESLEALLTRYPAGLVLKWSRMGYDGKGVFIVSSPDEVNLEELKRFIQEGQAKSGLVYAEAKIPFEQELAIVAVRSVTGEFKHYPLVFSKQENGICKKVWGPVSQWGVSQDLERKAAQMARSLAEKLDLVGSFALELFYTSSGDLLINEAAPRVHNSGHYTQDACACSQFENHWRALLALPLGDTSTRPFFAMLNLLGPEAVVKKDGIQSSPQVNKEIILHWYEKDEIRPRRKLGHLNIVAEEKKEFQSKLLQMEAIDEAWMKGLR